MWGTIDNKKIKNIKESYCLGEACLIFNYDEKTRRVVSFKTVQDLKITLDFFKKGASFQGTEIEDNIVKIDGINKLKITLANNNHAQRLKEVLDNCKR